ncbi:MAG: metalloregulator ArsR/SmtB family transcription factor [Planctomycetota bacterium]|nr:metalloregulator ArsR/SmtB family transcription factor [Planctomycetota bacterium]
MAKRSRAPKVDCVAAMKALADPNRLRVMNEILTGPVHVTAIAKACGMTAYNASRALSILAHAGLVAREKKAQQRLYRLSGACEALVDRRRRTLDLGCCAFRLDALVE